MSPETFCWAKDFLSSGAMQHLQGNWGHIDFSLPKSCPSDTGLASKQTKDSAGKTSVVIEELQEKEAQGESLTHELQPRRGLAEESRWWIMR
jgi:hypothetical protein